MKSRITISLNGEITSFLVNVTPENITYFIEQGKPICFDNAKDEMGNNIQHLCMSPTQIPIIGIAEVEEENE